MKLVSLADLTRIWMKCSYGFNYPKEQLDTWKDIYVHDALVAYVGANLNNPDSVFNMLSACAKISIGRTKCVVGPSKDGKSLTCVEIQ